MQAVDVLCDDRDDLAGSFQRGQGPVPVIRLRLFELAISLLLHLPILAACFLARKEVLKENRLVSAPDSPRTSKIRNAAFGADPCAGKCNGAPGFCKQLRDLHNRITIGIRVSHHGHTYFIARRRGSCFGNVLRKMEMCLSTGWENSRTQAKSHPNG